MVTKSKAGQKKGRVKVGKLKLNKETVKDLTVREKKEIRGASTVWGTCDHCCQSAVSKRLN
jgi:hypothetical protein